MGARGKRVVVALAIVGTSLATFGAFAETECGSAPRNAHDPFGSCEDADGRLHCGTNGAVSEEVPVAGSRVTAGEHGVQWCLDGENRAEQPYGRVTVYNSDGYVGFAADGEDRNDPGPVPGVALHAWTRVAVDTENPRACAASDATGTYWDHDGPDGGLVCVP